MENHIIHFAVSIKNPISGQENAGLCEFEKLASFRKLKNILDYDRSFKKYFLEIGIT